MPEPTPDDPPTGGRDAFLERITGSLTEDGPDPAPDPNPNPDPKPDPKPDPAPDPDPLDIEPKPGDAKPKPAGDPADPLDNLEPDPKPDPKDEPNPKEDPAPSADVLDTLDPDDKAKVQAYIDEQVAAEVTETKSAGGAFKRLKAENRTLVARAESLQAKLDQGDPDALKAATERVKELEEAARIREEADSVTKLEDTKAYKETIVSPLRDIIAKSDAIAKRYGVDQDQLADALEITDRRDLSTKINQLLGEDAVDADKFELFDLARQVERIGEKRTELRDNAESALEEAAELEGKAKEKAAFEARQVREGAVESTFKRLGEKAQFILDTVGDELAETIKAEIAENDISVLSPEEQAFARVASKALRPMAKKILTLEAELQEANDELVARRKAAPGSRGGGVPSPAEEPPPGDDDKRSFAERAASRISEAVASSGG